MMIDRLMMMMMCLTVTVSENTDLFDNVGLKCADVPHDYFALQSLPCLLYWSTSIGQKLCVNRGGGLLFWPTLLHVLQLALTKTVTTIFVVVDFVTFSRPKSIFFCCVLATSEQLRYLSMQQTSYVQSQMIDTCTQIHIIWKCQNTFLYPV